MAARVPCTNKHNILEIPDDYVIYKQYLILNTQSCLASLNYKCNISYYRQTYPKNHKKLNVIFCLDIHDILKKTYIIKTYQKQTTGRHTPKTTKNTMSYHVRKYITFKKTYIILTYQKKKLFQIGFGYQLLSS